MRSLLRAVPLALVVSLTANACGDDGGSPTGDPDGGRSDGGGGGGGGDACGDAPTIALGSWVERTVSVAGTGNRTYFVRLPADYDPDREYPVVYQLHGCSGSREANNVPVETRNGNDAINVRGRAIDECWESDAADVAYFDAMVAAVESSFCADTSKRFVTGYSSGSFFAHRLACVRGDVIRGVATIAGGSPGNSCVGEVAVLQIHDQNDTTVTITSSGYPTRDHWIAANHCESTTTPTDPSPCVAYDGCDDRSPVVWCETSGQNHSRQDALAANAFWEFLSGL